RACAHRARLECDVKSCAGEAIVVENSCGFADNDYFCMSGGVVVTNGAIAAAGDDLFIANENRADGDFSGCGRCARFFESELHVVEISWHGKWKNSTRYSGCLSFTLRNFVSPF